MTRSSESPLGRASGSVVSAPPSRVMRHAHGPRSLLQVALKSPASILLLFLRNSSFLSVSKRLRIPSPIAPLALITKSTDQQFGARLLIQAHYHLRRYVQAVNRYHDYHEYNYQSKMDSILASAASTWARLNLCLLRADHNVHGFPYCRCLLSSLSGSCARRCPLLSLMASSEKQASSRPLRNTSPREFIPNSAISVASVY